MALMGFIVFIFYFFFNVYHVNDIIVLFYYS